MNKQSQLLARLEKAKAEAAKAAAAAQALAKKTAEVENELEVARLQKERLANATIGDWLRNLVHEEAAFATAIRAFVEKEPRLKIRKALGTLFKDTLEPLPSSSIP